MRKILFIIIGVTLSLILLTSCGRAREIIAKLKESSARAETEKLVIDTGEKEMKFSVEIADDAEERARGYMFREKISEKDGIWFVFGEASPKTFWMRNVKFSLDMIFAKKVDDHFEIVEILSAVPPCDADPCMTYTSENAVSHVLEIKGGLAAEQGIELGDKIIIK